ncbi:MAG: formylglycine-generating enzyme family protein [Planctomycetes bacterium]|nr:formylglycine-generating enzyme family protein [Planctomycetota bacterium]
MKLVYIPPGTFTMGSPESEPGREAQEVQHEVDLTKGFYLGRYEVTVGQFKEFVKETKYETDGERDGKGAFGVNEAGKIEEMHAKFTWKSPGFEQTDDHPVVDVSWNDARAYCQWLSKNEKKTYRLPTEAEWEYACRAGTKTAYVHGDDPEGLATIGNGADATARARYPGWSIGIKAKDGHVFTAPVGQFKANAFGLHDVHGNVWEWCEDWYEPNSYPKEKQVDPTGPATGKAKVQRGGGWSSDAKRLRSAARVGRDASAYRGCYLGFRVVLVAANEKPTKEPEAVKKPPAGLRVMFNGNSWFNFVPGGVADQVRAAGIEGHKEVKAAKPNDFSVIEAGEVDVYAHGVHWWMEVPWGKDGVFAEKIVEMGRKVNPNFRAYYHAAWLVGDGRAKDIKTTADYDESKLADVQTALDKTRKGVETTVDKLNEKFGKRVVFLVPVGDATVKLRGMILEGKYPGVKKQSELWTDAMPHAGPHVMALSGYCHFAAIYRTSPVGLKIDRFKELTDEQHAILQKIAWETVSKYPYAGVAEAQDPKSEPAKKLPAGLHVAGAGNSWYSEGSEPLCKAAGIVGHKKITGINGNRTEDLTPLLEKGEFDAFVYGRTDIGMEQKLLSALLELGPKHNPNFRGIYVQMPWLVHDGRQGVKSAEEYEKTDLAEMQVKLEKSRKQQEVWADEVNAKASKRVVFLVPLGDGMLEVRKMIAAGKFPGETKQSGGNSVLRGDIMPHQGLLGMRLGNYMHFAALYRMSPEGLKFPGKDGDGLTDEQRAILQKLAWDMVSKYPYAGVAKFDAPKPPKDGEKPVPKSGDDATALPDALKGWKATTDLPAEAVVTDYNAYIQTLPKAERPGVSDVKYYVDDTGRNAVAVLVNVGGERWTHLLVYDKQNKQTSVTKFVANKPTEEPKAAPTQKPPEGLRVAYTLMSNGTEMDAIVKAANIVGHKATDAPYFGTWHGFVKGGKEGIPEKAQKQIASGGIDALTVATWTWAPNEETWHKHVGLDSALAGVAELGLEKNPNFRLCWRAFLKPATVKKGNEVVPDFVQTRKTLEKETKDLETHVDLVNKKHGRRVVLIVPHAQAGLALVDVVAAGKFPGITDPAELWMKEEAFNMNVHRHLRALAAYCDFAVIYGVSPEGLKPSFKGISYKSKGGAEHSMEGITDEQNGILQKLAWETVSKYPYTGVAR